AVGIDRCRWAVFGRRTAWGNPVHGRRRGEDEVLHARVLTALQQAARRARVVAVVLERIRHRFRHDRVCRKMHHGLDAVLAQDIADERSVARIPYDERRAEDCRTEAGREVVEDDYVFVALAKLTNDVAA